MRSWAPSCHPADQVLLLGWLVPTARGAEQGGDPAPGDSASRTYPSATMHGQEGGGDRDFLLSQQLRCQGAVVAPGSQPSQLSGLPKLPTPAYKEPSNPLDIFSPQHPWRCQLLLAVCRHPVAIITSSSLPEKNKLLYREGKVPSL